VHTVILRQATIEDSEFVFFVKKAALGEYIAETWGWDETFQREFHAKDYEPEKTQIILYRGQNVGWILIGESDFEFDLHEIYILPEYQSLGIGSHLIRLLLADAERRRKPVKLQVLKVNPRARRLYESLGFRLIGETDKHYLMGLGN
jgi:ribosomal protein S18 acetylase RimI-like enzyme